MLPFIDSSTLTDKPCPRCLTLAQEGQLRVEAVQRLPRGAWAPRAHDRSGPCCYDCAAADSLVPRALPDFLMARIAVANDRQEQYRMPGAPLGLVGANFVRPSECTDHADQLKWLDDNDWFGFEPQEGP